MEAPQYIGPYSADYYDNLYGNNNLFTPATDQPAADQSFLSKWDPTGWARMDLIVFIGIVLIVAGASYFVIKKTSK
jgi:hypothetical protein